MQVDSMGGVRLPQRNYKQASELQHSELSGVATISNPVFTKRSNDMLEEIENRQMVDIK